ncbi:unnamed protein product [Closterium sp. Yama58-4]|nr:unnamed protein product [Closterium sp. Yama58-4]
MSTTPVTHDRGTQAPWSASLSQTQRGQWATATRSLALCTHPPLNSVFQFKAHGQGPASGPAVTHPPAQTRPSCPSLSMCFHCGTPSLCLCRAVRRAAFERQYNGSILDFTLMRRQQQPLYCPRLLELYSYWKSYLLVDLMQRGGDELSFLRRTGDIIFSRVMPIGNLSLNLTGFTVGVPILQHALPPNPTEQQAEEVVLGAAGANTTDPNALTMIYGPGPRLLYYRDRDILPMTDISPPNITRPWEERSVVPLDLLGGRLRRYQVWCRYMETLLWGVPFLWAALALVLTTLVAAVAWQQRVGYMRSEESLAAADRLRGKARAAERSKSSFVASMSHELRTPMLGIVGLLDALEDRGLSATQRQDVRAARTAAHDTVRLVNRVLDPSKLEARRMPLCCSPFHPQVWLEEIVLGCCERAQDKGIEVAGMVDTGVPVVLHMDTMRLSQVLNELIATQHFYASPHVLFTSLCLIFKAGLCSQPKRTSQRHHSHTAGRHAMCYTARGHVLVRVSVCSAATPLEDFLHHHLHCPLHHHTPPPSHSWLFSWLGCLHTQLGLLVRRATAVCGGGGGEEMQLVLSCADMGCGFDASWEELSEFKSVHKAHDDVSPYPTVCGSLHGRSESGGAGLGFVLVHQLVSPL